MFSDRSIDSRTASILCLASAFVILGCGGTGTENSAPATAPAIIQQPASMTIPLDSAATLSVDATGSAPLQYQWSEDGNALPGATSSTLTTSALVLADSGDSFTVTVTNPAGSVTSKPAVITIGPRSPDPRDLRFKHVDFPQPLTAILSQNVSASSEGVLSDYYQTESVGTPMEVGTAGICAGTIPADENCGWHFFLFSPPPGVHGFYSFYGDDLIANLPADIARVAAMPSAVLTALDEEPAFGLLGYSYEQDQTVTSGFSQQFSTVTAASLQQAAQQLGTEGRVITAASVNSNGQFDLVSYTWGGAGSTTYDVQTSLATADTVEQQATALAAGGYILTAVGSGGVNSFVLVGTKVQGDTLPRPFYALSASNPAPDNPDPGLFPVGEVFDVNGNVTLVEE
jgi:hypothetical protein